MRIESNIAEVAARFGGFADRADATVRGAMEPSSWEPAAKLAAEQQLRLLAGESAEKQDLVSAFVETVMVTAAGQGMTWTMGEVPGAALDVAGIVRGTQDRTLGPLGEAAKLAGRRAVADLLLEWVSADPSEGGKQKIFPRDYDAQGKQLSPEKLAKRIYEILFKRQDSAARDSLLPHIQAFAERQRYKLGRDEVRQWLLAVLDAWRGIVMEQLPTQVAERLRAEF